MNIKTPFLRLRGGVLCYRDICNFAKVHVLSIYYKLTPSEIMAVIEKIHHKAFIVISNDF